MTTHNPGLTSALRNPFMVDVAAVLVTTLRRNRQGRPVEEGYALSAALDSLT